MLKTSRAFLDVQVWQKYHFVPWQRFSAQGVFGQCPS